MSEKDSQTGPREARNAPEPPPAAAEKIERARRVFHQKLDSGTSKPEDVEAFMKAVDEYADAMRWDDPDVRELIRQGRYRAPGLVVVDETGYDRGLAKRSVGPGWASLVDEVFDYCDAHCPGARIVQVKEKFGALRAYVEGPPECWRVIDEFTEEIERRSLKVCEECGAPGVLRAGRWIKTRCEAHAEGRAPLTEADTFGTP